VGGEGVEGGDEGLGGFDGGEYGRFVGVSRADGDVWHGFLDGVCNREAGRVGLAQPLRQDVS